MSEQGAPLGWYATCVAYFASPTTIRKDLAAQTLATYRRICRMPPEWGRELDRRGAPLFVLRWVVWGKDPAERERRYAEALAWWDRTKRWPRWDELTCRDGSDGGAGRQQRCEGVGVDARASVAGSMGDAEGLGDSR